MDKYPILSNMGEEKEINPIFYYDEVTENNVNSENLGIFNLFETLLTVQLKTTMLSSFVIVIKHV